MPRGIPSWGSLARAVWQEAFGKGPSPWSYASDDGSAQSLPQFLPIVLELAYWELGEERFVKILREKLYESARFPWRDSKFAHSHETLAVLARLIVQEYRLGPRRRITSIITLNADDLIEQAICQVASARTLIRRLRLVKSIARSTHARAGRHDVSFMPVYHVHGFLPSGHLKAYMRHWEYTLVFTDAQYWSTSAFAYSLANRIMTSALSEGCCVFIGLSMTDINLLRWLALRTLERDRDCKEGRSAAGDKISPHFDQNLRWDFERHYWIRPRKDNQGKFLSQFLRYRGVKTVILDSWDSEAFEKLMANCFPALEAGEE